MTGIDTVRWSRDIEEARVAARPSVREQLGLRGTIILFVGTFTPRKGISELLSALSLVAADPDLPPWSALFVGSGALTQDIKEWAHLHPAVPVGLTGFVQPSQLADYYAAADLFVMPSVEDVWGLVCLEALAAGIPQVTSRFAGAAADLVRSSEIGDVVDPRDPRSLSHHLADRIRIGPQQVPEAIRERTLEVWSTTAMAERAVQSIRLSLPDQAQPNA